MGSQDTSKFQGWLGLDQSAFEGNMKWGEFEPKKWTENDVDIEAGRDQEMEVMPMMLESGDSDSEDLPLRELR